MAEIVTKNPKIQIPSFDHRDFIFSSKNSLTIILLVLKLTENNDAFV